MTGDTLGLGKAGCRQNGGRSIVVLSLSAAYQEGAQRSCCQPCVPDIKSYTLSVLTCSQRRVQWSMTVQVYDGPSGPKRIPITRGGLNHTSSHARGLELSSGEFAGFPQLNWREEDSTVRFYYILGRFRRDIPGLLLDGRSDRFQTTDDEATNGSGGQNRSSLVPNFPGEYPAWRNVRHVSKLPYRLVGMRFYMSI